MIKGIGNTPSFISTISSKEDKENTKIDNVEKSKVDKIKEAIKNGSYEINIDKTASKIAKSLL